MSCFGKAMDSERIHWWNVHVIYPLQSLPATVPVWLLNLMGPCAGNDFPTSRAEGKRWPTLDLGQEEEGCEECVWFWQGRWSFERWWQ